MSSRSSRIKTGIDSLVRHLLEEIPGQDDVAAEQRESNAIAFVEEFLASSKNPAVVADVNQASDLIKKRLIQTNPGPEKALRFTNLYGRLLSIPVIQQKWAVLYFLYQLGDVQDPASAPTRPLISPPRRTADPAGNARPKPSQSSTARAESPLAEAFAPNGLRTLPDTGKKQSSYDDDASAHRRPMSQQVPETRSQSAILSDQCPSVEPNEAALLRDLPFTLQGLSSSKLPFSSATSLKIPPTLPVPLISILHALAEPSLLYRSICDFIASGDKALLGQSLRSALDNELRSYLGLIATLESQIRRALRTVDTDESGSGIGKAGVTLKRMVVWTREATRGLRLMSVICEESKSRRGGQLISLIHSFSASHGDPTVGAFAERLLESVTRPFYSILRQWIYDGELCDPFHEFFITEQGSDTAPAAPEARSRQSASNVWEDKFTLNHAMIPSIMTSEFASKVFLIGKSLNFIRCSCGDAAWVDAYSKSSSKELLYGDTATLEAWIDEAYKTTMARLTHLMSDKFHLFTHLAALKNYILLGQGDFIALLMESLASNLDRPAGAQYRHTLTAQLEHAIRGSNAQYDSPEVLRRLDARMLQLSHGDIGWDCFTLEYKIDAPVDVVVTEWGNRQYLKVFNFLWRIKRVEFALQTTWRKCMTGSRGVLQSNDPEALQAWKMTRGVLAEMIHWIGQLQYYILFEVIESSWDELQTAVRKENCTLDDIIRAHKKYLNAITHKGLLGAKRKHHSEGVDENNFMIQLGDILRLMLSFRDAVDGLYSWSVSEFTSRQSASLPGATGISHTPGHHLEDTSRPSSSLATPPVTSRRGPHAETTTPFPSSQNTTAAAAVASEFPALRTRLASLGGTYRARICALLGDLAHQADTDMRFLGVVMNFNDVYVARRERPPRRERDKDRDKGKESVRDGGGGRDGIEGEAAADAETLEGKGASLEKGKRR